MVSIVAQAYRANAKQCLSWAGVPWCRFAAFAARNSKGLINYYINSQIPFPANSNRYRFNNEFLSNQKL